MNHLEVKGIGILNVYIYIRYVCIYNVYIGILNVYIRYVWEGVNNELPQSERNWHTYCNVYIHCCAHKQTHEYFPC